MIDGSIAPDADEALHAALANHRVVRVRSKCDLPCHPAALVQVDAVAVSATTGEGLPALLARLGVEVMRVTGDDDEGQIGATLRQIEGLEHIAGSLHAAVIALASLPLEAALVDLRDALVATSDLLGLELGDAVLDRIFSTFCVGK